MRRLILFLSLATISATAIAEDKFNPKFFIDTKCSSCHDTEVYTRPDHKVKDLKALETQVRRCDANMGTGLFDDNVKAVVSFLNSTYYHF
jgi:cytochrome c5